MQKEFHKADQRGKGDHGWLHSRYSFSFANYYNPERTGFGKLLVLNDDTIAPRKGFGAHPHENMEIITFVLEGALEHKDSTGVVEVIHAGDIQVMSAGTGIVHSEYSASDETLQLFQIWIQPNKINVPPRHATKHFHFPQNKLFLAVSGQKQAHALFIHQDATLSIGKFDTGKKIDLSLRKEHGLYLFVIEGKVKVEKDILEKRDAIGVWDAEKVTVEFVEDSFIMMFDVPI